MTNLHKFVRCIKMSLYGTQILKLAIDVFNSGGDEKLAMPGLYPNLPRSANIAPCMCSGRKKSTLPVEDLIILQLTPHTFFCMRVSITRLLMISL